MAPQANIDSALLSAHSLSVGFKNKVLLADLNLSLSHAEFVCLIGVNGSGKTTLLNSLGGLHPSLSGEILLSGENLSSLSLTSLARLRSISLTDSYQSANLTVLEFISQGKWQAVNWKGKLPPAEEELVQQVSITLQMDHLLQMPIYELSDGERQRAVLARALVQDCRLILLDEPLSHLDPVHKHRLMEDFRHICHQQGKGIIITTHDWELAVDYADTLWWITSDQRMITGGPEDLMLSGFIKDQLTHTPLSLDLATGKISPNRSLIQSVHLAGDHIPSFWTQHGLRKIGIQAVDNPTLPIRILITSTNDNLSWELHFTEGKKSFQSITLLLLELEKLLTAS